MSRFDDYDYDEPDYPNAGELWAANVQRALSGRRGKKALAELREALRALPEKKLIEGALCTVGGVDGRASSTDPYGYYRSELKEKIEREGEGVCAIGAYLWYRKVKAGADPQAAFEALPTYLDTEGEGGWQTAKAGKAAGMTFTLAWSLAQRNDMTFGSMTPEERYEAFMKWLDEQLAEVPSAA